MNVQRWMTKDTALTALLCLLAVLILRAMVPIGVDANLEMRVSQSNVPIRYLHQRRDIGMTKVVHLDKLDLARHNRFYHSNLGDVGYGENFFADVEASFRITEPGTYVFVVASDDGFALRINGREVCSFVRDRALATQRCPIRLDAGSHDFQLSYFQGGGHAGLRVQYGRAGESKLYWFGENSPFLKLE
ncbi:PA14 domain-containing protein [Marinimicrobium sp. ABcell2]|uniref:PA14 domain-containing protein n=1 Tax=Marinimicrobium sp. ABcell2 TaxID=3069751 RepID=UPI0027AE3038|nr:PA14 domain-containing protein [Marinimicrobium sp. ABcell2]MDQ2077194.1 PA14 domain-containing protein [Marinimicrobium sp. ABcell2]